MCYKIAIFFLKLFNKDFKFSSLNILYTLNIVSCLTLNIELLTLYFNSCLSLFYSIRDKKLKNSIAKLMLLTVFYKTVIFYLSMYLPEC